MYVLYCTKDLRGIKNKTVLQGVHFETGAFYLKIVTRCSTHDLAKKIRSLFGILTAATCLKINKKVVVLYLEVALYCLYRVTQHKVVIFKQ